MPSTTEVRNEIKVGDEVFLATALLHQENPDREDFTVREILRRAEKENLYGRPRPGLRPHVLLHCVANLPPNPGRLRMLYATGTHTRRLLRSGDEVHPDRTGRAFPDPGSVPPEYRPLIEWAKRRHGDDRQSPPRWMDGIFRLRGLGKGLWNEGEADEYVKRLRENWG